MMGKNKTKPTTFLKKLHSMLSNDEHRQIICWGTDGEAFAIKNTNDFCCQILSQYFKHSNFASFVRQLNMYGFHKAKIEGADHAFSHPSFKQNDAELLSTVLRKTNSKAALEMETEVLRESDREKVKRKLSSVKKETKLLRCEVAALSENYKSVLKELQSARNRERNYQKALKFLMNWNQQLQGFTPSGFDTILANLKHEKFDIPGPTAAHRLKRSESEEAETQLSYNIPALLSSDSCTLSDPETVMAVLSTTEGLSSLDEFFSNIS